MSQLPEKPRYFDDEEYGETWPVATIEGNNRPTLRIGVGTTTIVHLKLENVQDRSPVPLLEYFVDVPNLLVVSHQVLSSRKAVLQLMLYRAEECELTVYVNDGVVDPEAHLRDGERLVIKVIPMV